MRSLTPTLRAVIADDGHPASVVRPRTRDDLPHYR
jgi:hypothetical protein